MQSARDKDSGSVHGFIRLVMQQPIITADLSVRPGYCARLLPVGLTKMQSRAGALGYRTILLPVNNIVQILK